MATRSERGDDPRWIMEVITPGNDFILRRKVPTAPWEAKGEVKPQPGEAHELGAKYPGYKVAGIVPGDEEGWAFVYYAKTRANQQAYNFEHGEQLNNEWPEVQQTWAVLRADYKGTSDPAPVAPLLTAGMTWTHIGRSQQRMDARTDSLFVVYVDTWRDISTARTGSTVDLETNTLRSFSKRMVPAGTAGQVVGNDGQYKQVQPINRLWSIETTEQATGLAGSAVNGKATRTFEMVMNYSWPRVLDYVYLQPVYQGSVYGPVDSYIVAPIYKAYAYSGACLATVIEEWTKVRPRTGGNPNWPTETPGYPDYPRLDVPVEMLPNEISFNGASFNVQVPPCLHSGYRFWDSQFSQYFPPTSPTQWPATLVASVDLRQEAGGWLKRTILVHAPSIAGVSSGLDLTLVSSTTTTATLQWTPQGSIPVLELRLDVSTDPTFRVGFLSGFQNKLITPGGNTPPLQTVVDGMARGIIYYARVRRISGPNVQTSNTLTMLSEPQPELTVTVEGDEILISDEAVLEDVTVGVPATFTVVLRNPGLLTLTLTSAAITGAQAADYALSDLPASLGPGEEAELTLTVTAAATGARECVLTILSSSLAHPSYDLSFYAMAIAPEIAVAWDGDDWSNGSTLDLAPTGLLVGTTLDFDFTIRNDGTGDLTLSALLETEDELSIITMPAAVVEPGDETTLVVRAAPASGGTKVGVLRLTNNDGDEGSFALNLSVITTTAPEIEVVSPYDGVLLTGSSVGFGRVAFSAGARAMDFLVRNVGSSDLTLSSVLLSGTDAARWAVTSISAGTVPAGSSATIRLTYTPLNANVSHTAVVTITTDDTSEPTTAITLTATSQSTATNGQRLQVEIPGGTVIPRNGTLALGALPKGVPVEYQVTLRNTGAALLSSLGASKSGTHSGDVSLSSVSPITIAASASTPFVGLTSVFTLTYTPTDFGARTSAITITSDDLDGATYVINITATGILVESLVTHQSAAVILGQASETAQVSATSDLVTKGPTAVAVNADGWTAVCDTSANRVLLFAPEAETGDAARYVLGQPDFTTATAGVTATKMSAPRGVCWSGSRLIVSDTGNNRVLIWDERPTVNAKAPDVVLGQSVFTSNAAGCTQKKLYQPVGVCVDSDGNLWCADSFNHRVVRFSGVPTASYESVNLVLGQTAYTTRLYGSAANRLNKPLGVAVSTGGKVCVADTGNNRVLVFNTTPATYNTSADVVAGQTGFSLGAAATTAARMRAPEGVAIGANGCLAVSESGNNRVVIFNAIPTASGASANIVLGQANFTTSTAFAGGVSAQSMSAPRGLGFDGNALLVAGATMKRVMRFEP